MEYAHPLDIYDKYIVKNLITVCIFLLTKKREKIPLFIDYLRKPSLLINTR